MASEWIDELQKATVSLQNIGKLPRAGHGQNSEGGGNACIADKEKDDSMDLARALEKLAHQIRALSATGGGGDGGKHGDTVQSSGEVRAMPCGQPRSRSSEPGSMLPATNDHASDGQELRDTSEHSSFGPRSGPDIAAIVESEQIYFDPNEPPSMVAAEATSDLDFEDEDMLLNLGLWEVGGIGLPVL